MKRFDRDDGVPRGRPFGGVQRRVADLPAAAALVKRTTEHAALGRVGQASGHAVTWMGGDQCAEAVDADGKCAAGGRVPGRFGNSGSSAMVSVGSWSAICRRGS